MTNAAILPSTVFPCTTVPRTLTVNLAAPPRTATHRKRKRRREEGVGDTL